MDSPLFTRNLIKTLNLILDLTIPYVCELCHSHYVKINKIGCDSCLGQLENDFIELRNNREIFYFFQNRGKYRKLLKKAKFENNTKALLFLCSLLTKTENILSDDFVNTEKILIPSTSSFNEDISRNIFIKTKFPNIIQKINKQKIKGLGLKSRLKHAESLFGIDKSVKLSREKIYFLIDDVSTTGASLIACQNLLVKEFNIKKENIKLFAFFYHPRKEM